VDGVSVADPNNLNIFLNERVFNDELIGGIFPYVEAHYRVIPDREKRAIGGFSRGGGQSLFAGFVAGRETKTGLITRRLVNLR
jgi:enterochelin esterase-like enzyme